MLKKKKLENIHYQSLIFLVWNSLLYLNGGAASFIYSFLSLPLCLRTGFTGFNNSQKFYSLKMSFGLQNKVL